MSDSTIEDRMTKVETTVWGAFGTNGLNGDVKRHGEQIGDLYGRDETLREDVNRKLDALNSRLLSLTIAVAAGALGIVGALLASTT